MTRKLTAMQRKFVNGYLKGMTATEAARKAGYSPKNASNVASELLGKPLVIAEIEKRMKKINEKTDYTVQKWREELLEIRETLSEKIPVYQNEDGEVIMGLKDAPSLLKAYDMLGKHLGLFVEKKQVEVNISDRSSWLNDVLKDMKDE